jgi:hypothetical protein
VLGTEIPLRFLSANRAIESVLSKNVSLLNDFRRRYPDYRVVIDYYLPRRGAVNLVDVSEMLLELTEGKQLR